MKLARESVLFAFGNFGSFFFDRVVAMVANKDAT